MSLQGASEAGINARTAVRYLFAGATAAGVNFLSRFPLSQFLPFESAVLGAQCVGFGAGFLLYRTFVFRDAATALPRQIAAFIGVNAVSTVFVLLIATLLRDAFLSLGLALALSEAAAHAGGICSGTGFNFLGHRFLTFARG